MARNQCLLGNQICPQGSGTIYLKARSYKQQKNIQVIRLDYNILYPRNLHRSKSASQRVLKQQHNSALDINGAYSKRQRNLSSSVNLMFLSLLESERIDKYTFLTYLQNSPNIQPNWYSIVQLYLCCSVNLHKQDSIYPCPICEDIEDIIHQFDRFLPVYKHRLVYKRANL